MVKDSELWDSNPWWRSASSINQDKRIIEWEKSSIRYDSRAACSIEYDFDASNSVIYTLRGPRQVGKTTMIKMQIREFLKNNVNPWNIFYYSLDLIDSRREVVEIIQSYIQLSKRHKNDSRRYMFLDEITAVPEWQKGIKWLVDNDRLTNCTLLVTGSQAINIQNATERLPGRRGRTKNPFNKSLLPMKFSSYVTLLDRDVKKSMSKWLPTDEKKTEILLQLLSGDIDGRMDVLFDNHINELNAYLKKYSLTGGTPKIVNEYDRKNFIEEDIYSDYLEGIRGDWRILKKNEVILKQFADAVIKNQGSHTSWNNMRKDTDAGSRNTVAEYGEALQDMLTLDILYEFNQNTKKPSYTRNKKMYFRDPFYVHMFRGWLNSEDPFVLAEDYIEDPVNMGKMVEGISADHLIRLAFRESDNKHVFDHSNHVFYWKNKNNVEVDFILYMNKKFNAPIEVKFRNSVNRRELGGVTSFMNLADSKRGIILSKNEFDVGADYVVIPAALFLMLI